MMLNVEVKINETKGSPKKEVVLEGPVLVSNCEVFCFPRWHHSNSIVQLEDLLADHVEDCQDELQAVKDLGIFYQVCENSYTFVRIVAVCTCGFLSLSNTSKAIKTFPLVEMLKRRSPTSKCLVYVCILV